MCRVCLTYTRITCSRQRTPMATAFRFAPRNSGSTLPELAIILVIIGILLGAGLLAWTSLAESRRVSKTRSQLESMKQCLVRAVLFTEHYPRDDDFNHCQNMTGKDAWGNPLHWIIGTNSTGTRLAEQHAVITDTARNQTAAPVNEGLSLRTTQGEHNGVAFALVSLGPDQIPDHPAYAVSGGTLSADLDLTNATDDLVLVVTGYELTATIRDTVGR